MTEMIPHVKRGRLGRFEADHGGAGYFPAGCAELSRCLELRTIMLFLMLRAVALMSILD